MTTQRFFQTGGHLHPDSPSYVKRPADDVLFSKVLEGELCYVLTTRQMGKSSLMVRTVKRLQEMGINAVIVDLTLIGSESEDKWFFGFFNLVRQGLNLSVDLKDWWQKNQDLGKSQRFFEFLRQIVLNEIQNDVVIFIDEIDMLLILEFGDDFFALIRAIHNSRTYDPIFKRLTFVLIGLARPSDLVKQPNQTPFNIGSGVNLNEFDWSEAQILKKGLECINCNDTLALLERIVSWTNGHPYLTQRICYSIVQDKDTFWSEDKVDQLINELFLSDDGYNDSNIDFIQDQFNHLDEAQLMELLKIYRDVYNGKSIIDDEKSIYQSKLKLIGLIKNTKGKLAVRNRIYKKAFNQDWILSNLPQDNKAQQKYLFGGLALVFAIILIVILSNLGSFKENPFITVDPIRFTFSDVEEYNQWTSISGRWGNEEIGTFQPLSEPRPFDLITLFNRPVLGDYVFQTDIRIMSENAGAGLIFNAPTILSKNGGALVRFRGELEGNSGLYVVDFDKESGQFSEKGFQSTGNVADGEWHTLELIVKNQTYSIFLDEEEIFKNIPFVQETPGYLGLAVYNSSAQFDNVVLNGNFLPPSIASETPTEQIIFDFKIAEQSYEFDWLEVRDSGAWQFDYQNGVYLQNIVDEHDHITFFDFPLNNIDDYYFQVDFQIEENRNFGGAGVVFNALNNDDKAGAFMIRSQLVADGATGLFWGVFDENGSFEGQGFLPQPFLDDKEWHQLGVSIINDTYSIQLDNDILISGIPFTRRTSSFMGLVTNQAQVQFDNYNLDIWERR